MDNRKEFLFKGWIPNVSGRLSFDVLGSGGAEHDQTIINQADIDTRCVICHERRLLWDSCLPLKQVFCRFFLSTEGEFHFLLAGWSSNNILDREAPLKGKVLLFHDRHVWRSKVQPLVIAAQANLDSYSMTDKSSPRISLEQYFRNTYEEFLQQTTPYSVCSLDYSLGRDGVVTLCVPESAFQNRVGPPLPSHPEDEEWILHTITSQYFFFLKDAVHVHQHHDSRTDTMVDLHLVKNSEDDYLWRCDTLRGLYRRVYAFKRQRELKVFNCANGILAYIRTFKEVSAYLKTPLLPEINDALIEKSIISSQANIQLEISDKIRKQDVITSILLGMVGLLFSYVSMIRLTGHTFDANEVSPHLLSSGKFLLNSPLLVLGGLILLLMLALIAFKVIQPMKWGVIRWIARILQTQRQRPTGVGLFLLAVVVLLMTLKYVLSP